jgi:hypothetical protein
MRTLVQLRAKGDQGRCEPSLPPQGIASADMALWEAISTAVESLSWDNVQMNEVGAERNSRVSESLPNNRVILAPALIGLFAMTPDEFSEKCRQLASARNCQLFRGRDGSIAFRLSQPRHLS